MSLTLVEQQQSASQIAPSVIRPGLAIPPATLQPTLRKRVKTAVVAQLGNEVNPRNIETIINRVSDDLGIK